MIATLFVMCGLARNAVVENQSRDAVIPALRRRPVWIGIFHPCLWHGNVQYACAIIQHHTRQAGNVIAGRANRMNIGQRLFFERQ